MHLDGILPKPVVKVFSRSC